MKVLPLVLCACFLATTLVLGQQTPAPVILQIYVTGKQDPPLFSRIALGLAQPSLKISRFERVATVTNLQTASKLDGVAMQLTPEDAKTLTAALDDRSTAEPDVPNGSAVWFATSDNKVLGHMGRDPLQRQIAKDGVLAVFAEDDTALYNYLCSTLHPK